MKLKRTSPSPYQNYNYHTLRVSSNRDLNRKIKLNLISPLSRSFCIYTSISSLPFLLLPFGSVKKIAIDVNVTCGGKEITIQISPLYVRRNSKWLRDGTFLRILFTNQHHYFIILFFLLIWYKIFLGYKFFWIFGHFFMMNLSIPRAYTFRWSTTNGA